MAAKNGNRSPENSARRGAWKRHAARMPETTSRPWNLFLSASAAPSCGTIRANARQSGTLSGLWRAASLAIRRWRLVKNGDEHRRYILQEILRLAVLEQCGVLF